MENDSIVETMRSETTKAPNRSCAVFDLGDIEVSYEKGDLIGNMEIIRARPGVKVVGVTLVLTPSATSPEIYAMAVTSHTSGISLPVSLMATTNKASLTDVTEVAAQMIIAYYEPAHRDLKTCQVVKTFPISG
jgi:hypothetical protein